MISAEYPPLSMASRALAMHAANVSTSLRQGITIETSTAAGSSCAGDAGRGATFMALEPNAGCRPRLAVAAEKSRSMPGGALGRIIRSRDYVAGTPKDSHLPGATQRGRGEGLACGGDICPTANKSDPDGSPLKNWYLPCGLFLLSRTFPSGPLPRLETAVVERKPRKSVRRQATISSLSARKTGRSFLMTFMRSRPCGRRRPPGPGR